VPGPDRGQCGEGGVVGLGKSVEIFLRRHDAAVPEPLLHRLKIGAAGEQPGGVGVPEIVDAGPEAELGRVSAVLTGEEVRQEVEETFTKLETALERDSDEWKALIPGKQVLAVFAAQAHVSLPRAKALYIGQAAKSQRADC